MENPDYVMSCAEWTDFVRDKLLEIWSEQTCQRPADWPEVRDRLMETLAPLVNDAVAELARSFSDYPPADDSALAVWRAFPRLHRANCAMLATLLIDGRAASLRQKTAEPLT